MTIRDLLDPTRVDLTSALEELRRTRSATFDSVHLTRDGVRLPMATAARLVQFDGRLCVVALSRDDSSGRQFRRQLARANTELEQAVEERTKQLEAFSEDLKILHGITTQEFDTHTDRVNAYLNAGCEMFGLPVGILSSTPTDPDTGETLYRIEAVLSPDPALEAGLTVPLSEAFCDAVLETEATVAYADTQEENPEHPACVNRGLRSFIGTPLWVEGEIIGTLNFVSPEPRPGGFTPSERDLIEVMAQAIGRRIEAKRVADERIQAQERYRSIVETVDAGVIVVDASYHVITANPSAKRFLGLSNDLSFDDTGQLDRRWPMIDTEGNIIGLENLPERTVLQTGNPVRGEIQGVCPPTGGVRWYRVNATPIDENSDGVPDAVVVSFHDVSDLRDSNAAIERSQSVMRSVLEASPDGVIAFRSIRNDNREVVDFEFLVVNQRGGSIVGKDPSSLVGLRLLDVFPGNRDTGLLDEYIKVVETGTRFETQAKYTHDGLDTTFRITAVPLPSEDGFTVTFSEAFSADLEDEGVEPVVLEAEPEGT